MLAHFKTVETGLMPSHLFQSHLDGFKAARVGKCGFNAINLARFKGVRSYLAS